MSSNPFLPTPEQLAAAAAEDGRLASLRRLEAELLEARAPLDASTAVLQARLTKYREEVLDPAERAHRAALMGIRPLIGDVRSAKAHLRKHKRKLDRVEDMRRARITQIKEKLSRQNLIASQKELFASFRQRRRRNLFKPEYSQCESSNTPTASTTPDTSPPPAPSNSA